MNINDYFNLNLIKDNSKTFQVMMNKEGNIYYIIPGKDSMKPGM